MKKILVTVVIFCVSYFIIGFVLVLLNIWDQGSFNTYAAIAGGIASVIGLLSFTRPSISQDDINALEIKSLKKLSDAVTELQDMEEKRSQTQEEIDKLAAQRQSMEILVKKASLSLFAKDQLKRHIQTIDKIIQSNDQLKESIKEYEKYKEMVYNLEKEIEEDSNSELLKEIISITEKTTYRPITFSDFLTNSVVDMVRNLIKIYRI